MDQLGGGEARGVDLEQLPRLRAEQDRLCAAREHAAALRDLGLVVVLPARARQIEQALALGQAAGAGVGVDEDVAVVERRHQLDVLGQQHAVAEHVTRHVADTHDPERLALDVDVHLEEVPLDALPGAARRDGHALVVVAGRAAGGERIAQPEIVLGRDVVGDVGERGSTLVGGHHEIGVVAVVTHHVARRDHLAVLDVVGDVEQGGDEDAIGGHAFLLDLLAAARARQLLGQEAALGARGHDDGILDELGAHEPQDLRAEVLHPVRPADAAARDRRKAQMDGLHARRVDPDLAEGAGLRRRLHGLAVQLEGERGRPLAVSVRLVEVGAYRGVDQVVELAQDAVLVQARHGGECAFDALPHRLLGRLPLCRAQAAMWIEAQVE